MSVEEGLDFVRRLDEFGEVGRKWVVLKEAETDPQHGKVPTRRSLEELLRLGIINLDKPPGPTSHEIVAWLKNMLCLKRAGHGGTLEP